MVLLRKDELKLTLQGSSVDYNEVEHRKTRIRHQKKVDQFDAKSKKHGRKEEFKDNLKT